MIEQRFGINNSPKESFKEGQGKITESPTENSQGNYISSIEEVLRFEKQGIDYLKREQDIENYKYVKEYKLNMEREVPIRKPDSNFLPQREIHRYSNLTEEQEKQIWRSTFKFKDNVCCSWNDSEGKKLITITSAVSSETNPEGQELIEFTMNLFQFDPNLTCISQLLRPSHSRVIKQLSIINDEDAQDQLYENIYNYQWMNIVVSPDEQHILIRGFGKIRYFRLPRQRCLKDFFSPSYDPDNPAHNIIEDDKNLEELNVEEDPGFKIYTFATSHGEKTFYLFHNEFNRMQYLCDETDASLIELIDEIKDNCNLVYPVGEELTAFVEDQSVLMIIHNEKGKLNIDALEGIKVIKISADFKSELKTLNVLTQQKDKFSLNLYEINDRELKFLSSFQINHERVQLIKQFRNQFFICSMNSRIIRFEVKEISKGNLEICQLEEVPSFIFRSPLPGSKFMNQIQNSSFVIFQFQAFLKFDSLPTLEQKEHKESSDIKIRQGSLHFVQERKYRKQQVAQPEEIWYSFYEEKPLKSFIQEIAEKKQFEIIDTINELDLIMFKTSDGEDSKTLYIVSPLYQQMILVENFDSYLGRHYQKQNVGDPFFRFTFLTKNRKLISIGVPNTDLSGFTIATVDLPKSPANGIPIMSDNGVNFIYCTESDVVSFELQQDLNAWKQLESKNNQNLNDLENFFKQKKIYQKHLNDKFYSMKSLKDDQHSKLMKEIDTALLNQSNYIDRLAKETNKIIDYLHWIIKCKHRDDSLYFIERSSKRVQFIIKFNEIKDVIVDDEIKEDIYIQNVKYQCYKLNILRDLPGYIPRNLLVVENAVSVYDLANPNEINYFENAQKLQQYQCIGTLQLRTGLNDIKDRLFQEQFNRAANKPEDEAKQKREAEQKIVHELIQNIEKNQLNDILSYNITFRHHIIKSVKNFADYKTIFDYLQYKFQISSPEQIPFMNPDISYQQLYQQDVVEKAEQKIDEVETKQELEKSNEERKKKEEADRKKNIKTPFDILINLKHHGLINAFLTAMIEKDLTGSLYSDQCDKHVLKMVKLGIDLKPYFSSQLVFHLVSDFYYKSDNAFSNSDTPFIAISDHNSIFDIRLNILQIEKENVIEQSKQDKPKSNQEEESEQKYEHRIVTLKQTLKNPTGGDFIKMLYKISENDSAILEIDSIRSIIEFKWIKYGIQAIRPFFILMMAFLGLFVIDQSMNQVSFASYTQYILRLGQFAILTIFMIYQRQQRLKGKKEIPVEDITLFISFSVFMILSFTYGDSSNIYLQNCLKCVQCMTVIFIFVKFCILIRIFTELSFLITLIESVFKDLRYFLLFFGIVVGVFTLILNIILGGNLQQEKQYFGIALLDTFVMTMRQSIGDWSTDEITQNVKYDELSWITWFMIAVVGNIVFMNFIIAVVSQSYENSIGRIVPETERAKLSMIIESERMLKESDFNDASMFPKYIIVRRKTAGGQGSNDASQQWQGFVKEIKIDNQKVQDGIKKDIQLMKSRFNSDIEDIKQQAINDSKQIKTEIETMKSEIQSNFGNLDTQMKSEMKSQFQNLEADIGQMKSNLEEDIGQMKSNLEADIGQMKSRFDTLESKMEKNAEMLVTIIQRLSHH